MRATTTLIITALLLTTAAACTLEDPSPVSSDGLGSDDGGFSWDWYSADWNSVDWKTLDQWTPPADLLPREVSADGPAPTSAKLIAPVAVKGAACSSVWQDTGSSASGFSCQAHLGSVQLRVGAGAEPQRYGCKIACPGASVRAILYEAGCDDKAVKLDCGYFCFN